MEEDIQGETRDSQIKREEIPREENQNSIQSGVEHSKTPTPGKKQNPLFENSRTDQFLHSFDGQIRIKDIPNLSTTSSLKNNPKSFQPKELGFGFLIHPGRKKPKKQFVSTGKFSWNRQKTNRNPSRQDLRVSQSFITDNNHKPYKIQGGISLKEGLPFLGSMEVSWVMDNSVFRSGSINTSNATYEIHVDQLVGDIVVSLYDENNILIGEGSMDLGHLYENPDSVSRNIEVFPIDWDHAGQAIHGLFLDSKNKPLSGVKISLYAFNESTTTDPSGNFGFPNWKKTNSRSIALASKSGYHDSIFLMDSGQPALVPLFPRSHIESFFSYLEDQGIPQREKGGIIHGSILGNLEKSGYKVSIEGQDPIYFSPLGFADTKAKATSSNGLFSFVGLENGDYRILLEKQGELVDERWVVVESSKISPVLFNPGETRPPGFFNSTNPEEFSLPEKLAFFDNNDSPLPKQRDFSEISALQSSVMGSQNHPQSQNPVTNDQASEEIPQISEKLHALAKQHGMQIHDGLIFGFVDSTESYKASLVEETAGKIIYFNEEAVKIDPNQEIASGFIMGGFSRGLNSLAIESRKTSMVLTTDLVFSDHQSISLINMEVFPVEEL